MKVYKGNDFDTKAKFAIICSEWNDEVNDKLIENAEKKLSEIGVDDDNISFYRVPGGLEIPRMAKKLAANKRFDAIICFGTLLDKSITFQYECNTIINQLTNISVNEETPIVNGVIMVKNVEEALKLADEDGINYGAMCVSAAFKIISVEKDI